MPSVILSAWGGARILIDSRAPSRQRESTCSEVFRAPVGWSVRLREAYGSMSFTIIPICSYLRSLHCASISNGKMGVLSGESPGWRRQKLSRFFLSAFLEPGGGGGEPFPAPETQFIELSQITVHPDRSLIAIDQSWSPPPRCIPVSRKSMFSEICVIWKRPLGCILLSGERGILGGWHSGRLAVDGLETHLGAEGGSHPLLSLRHTRLREPGVDFRMPEDKEGRGEAELGHAPLILKWKTLTS